jgi:PRTRC genetic system protein B
MIAWWTPAQRRQMFYQHSEGKAADLNGRIFPQPPLVWRVADGQLKIRALIENKRPEAKTKLAVAPYWNLSDSGTVCTGSMRRPENASVAAISDWERGFYESAFTHANVGRLTRHKGGFEGLWSSLAGKRRLFPLALIRLRLVRASAVRMLAALRRFLARRRLVVGTPIFVICHIAPSQYSAQCTELHTYQIRFQARTVV